MSTTPPYAVAEYPDLLRALAEAAAAELEPVVGERAVGVAFELSEMVRHQVGGARFRLPVWQPAPARSDLFSDDVPRPTAPPEIAFRGDTNNVDLIGFARDCAAWTIAGAQPEWSGTKVADLAARIADRFHREVDGRDQTYLSRGCGFDSAQIKKRIWDEFRGHNYNELALRYRRSEMRIRQIINEMRAASTSHHQPRLFD